MRKTETFTLPAGTICKRNGIPFELAEDTKILCHPANIDLITEVDSCLIGAAMTPEERAAGALPAAVTHE